MCLTLVSPRAAALRILANRYRTTNESTTSHTYSLAAFQEEAVARAQDILQRRGGVIIADSVGLGKTYIAAALIESQLRLERNCVVVVPEALIRTWRRALQPLTESFQGRVKLLTHGQLSRGRVVDPDGLVVIDEAHAFRNPATRRYRSLRWLSRSSSVVLLTATPVNNSLSDLYFQIRLFAADNAFIDLGIGSLSGLLRAAVPDRDGLRRLRAAVLIRRTRSEVRARFQQIELPGGELLRFPQETSLTTVAYSPPVSIDAFEPLLMGLRLSIYQSDATTILVRLSLLKRLQSGQRAILLSIDRLLALHERYLASLNEGRLLTPRLLRNSPDDQLFFPELVSDEVPATIDVATLRSLAKSDLAALQTLHASISQTQDEKIQRLIRLLAARAPPARTIVFTEFRDTAEDLWRRLRARFQVALVTGSGAWLGSERCSRAEIVKRFAPRANAARPPHPHEAVHVLIATDVLAEGLNLQDADSVINYDLPWNPVRLIQRAGRVDRIGSEFNVVQVYNFVPDREFDKILGVMRRLRTKLSGIRASVGQEGIVLEQDELDGDYLASLAAADARVLNEGVDLAFREELPFLADAGPIGCVASSASSRCTLVCWSNRGSWRELIVCEDNVTEDSAETDLILRTALLDRELRPFHHSSAITASQAYLKRDTAIAQPGRPETASLNREIRTALKRLGLLITDEVARTSEEVLAFLPGYLGNLRRDVSDLRAATTPAAVLDALAQIRSACTALSGQKPAQWRLISAIAAD